MHSALHDVAFRRLWAANLTSTLGSQIARIAIILFLFHRANSGLVALFVVAATVPAVVCAPFAGAIIDRSNKRTVLVASELAHIAASAAILLRPEPAVIYAATLIASVASGFFEPARAASVPMLVERPDRPSANSLDQVAMGIVLVAGPVAGANIFVGRGITAAIAVDLVVQAAALLLIAGLPLLEGTQSGGVTSSIREGWQYILTHDSSLCAVLLVGVSIFCVTLWVPLAPDHLRHFFADSDRILAIQTGVFGVGAMLGGVAAPYVVRRGGSGVIFFGGLGLEAVVLAVYSQVRAMVASVAVCLVWGICVSLTLAAYYGVLQDLVGSAFLGRVLAFAQQGEGIATIASMAIAGALFRRASSESILLVAGIAYLAVVSLSAMTRPGTRLRQVR